MGVASLPPSFPPSGTWAFYSRNRQNCVYFCNTVYVYTELPFKCRNLFYSHESNKTPWYISLPLPPEILWSHLWMTLQVEKLCMENFSNSIGHSLEYCFSNNVRTAINFPLAVQRETVWQVHLKVRDFQEKIGIRCRLKQICHFTILNSSLELSQIFCYIQQNISE